MLINRKRFSVGGVDRLPQPSTFGKPTVTNFVPFLCYDANECRLSIIEVDARWAHPKEKSF